MSKRVATGDEDLEGMFTGMSIGLVDSNVTINVDYYSSDEVFISLKISNGYTVTSINETHIGRLAIAQLVAFLQGSRESIEYFSDSSAEVYTITKDLIEIGTRDKVFVTINLGQGTIKKLISDIIDIKLKCSLYYIIREALIPDEDTDIVLDRLNTKKYGYYVPDISKINGNFRRN